MVQGRRHEGHLVVGCQQDDAPVAHQFHRPAGHEIQHDLEILGGLGQHGRDLGQGPPGVTGTVGRSIDGRRTGHLEPPGRYGAYRPALII